MDYKSVRFIYDEDRQMTIAYLRDEHTVCFGVAHCSKYDKFTKRDGARAAIERLELFYDVRENFLNSVCYDKTLERPLFGVFTYIEFLYNDELHKRLDCLSDDTFDRLTLMNLKHKVIIDCLLEAIYNYRHPTGSEINYGCLDEIVNKNYIFFDYSGVINPAYSNYWNSFTSNEK